MEKFIFGVLTYNQESYVLETLESIKYQKIHYGENIDVELIITDDASKDGTVQRIRVWLEKNNQYFAKVDLIANEQNQGTVANYLTILEKVGQEDFKVIAGDDLIGRENLFEEYKDLDEKTLKTYFRVELCDGKINYREKYLIDFYYHKQHNHEAGYHLKNFRRGRYLHTPSTIFKKGLFVRANCEKHLEGFRIYEDEPTWYSMIRNEKNLKIDFVEKGIVLYRMHNKSISNVPNPVFRSEVRKMKEWYLEDTKGLEKLYMKLRMFNNIPRYLNISVYVEKISHLIRKWKCRRDPDFMKFKEKIEQQIRDEQKFYDDIKAEISKQIV